MAKLYRIPVSWTVMATMEVEAASLDEAIEKADNMSLPTDPEYVEGSFQIDHEFIPALNPGIED